MCLNLSRCKKATVKCPLTHHGARCRLYTAAVWPLSPGDDLWPSHPLTDGLLSRAANMDLSREFSLASSLVGSSNSTTLTNQSATLGLDQSEHSVRIQININQSEQSEMLGFKQFNLDQSEFNQLHVRILPTTPNWSFPCASRGRCLCVFSFRVNIPMLTLAPRETWGPQRGTRLRTSTKPDRCQREYVPSAGLGLRSGLNCSCAGPGIGLDSPVPDAGPGPGLSPAETADGGRWWGWYSPGTRSWWSPGSESPSLGPLMLLPHPPLGPAGPKRTNLDQDQSDQTY